jgi:hypothetical protein
MILLYSVFVKRRTVSLTEEALAALDRMAKENRTTVSGVVEAAGRVLSDGGSGAEALRQRLVPDRRGGDRSQKSSERLAERARTPVKRSSSL